MLELLQELLKNEVFSGLVGGSFVVSMVFLVFRGIPEMVWRGLRWRWTTRMVIYNEDPAFDKVLEWLTTLDYNKKARRLRLSSQDQSDGETFWTPGSGTHLVWHRHRPIVVERLEPPDGKGTMSWKRKEDLALTTLGSDPSVMHELVREIITARQNARRKKTDVYLFHQGWWSLSCRKTKRGLDTVVLPQEQKERIVGDIEKFLERREWYERLGVPYRRGHLYQGPTGSGKTSLVMALAARFNRPVYGLNLGSLGSDDVLFAAVAAVPEEAILLMEDVDTVKATASRTEPEDHDEDDEDDNVDPNLKKPKNPEPKGITLAGLLNAIDGPFTKEGRILIMTTNHPEVLDSALIRPGRADLKETIGPIEGGDVVLMCKRFMGDEEGEAFAKTIDGPIVPAELENLLLQKAS